MAVTASQRRRREEATHCHYCGCELSHPQHTGNQKGPLPDNAATIEHMNSRLQYPNGRPKKANTIVIVCSRCNSEKARYEELALSLNELRRRSGRLGLSYKIGDVI